MRTSKTFRFGLSHQARYAISARATPGFDKRPQRGAGLGPPSLRLYSTLSFALAAATVCHCMLLGESAPPRLSGTAWSIT